MKGGMFLSDIISDDMITSEVVVKTHYEEAMSEACQLSGEFKNIIAGVNNELEMRRSLDSRLQKWRDQLKTKKEEVLKKGDKLEAEEQVCKEEQEELHKKIIEIEEKQKNNKMRMIDICRSIKSLEKEEKKTCIAKEKKHCNHKQTFYLLVSDVK